LSTHIEHRKGGHLADRTRKLAKTRETIRLAVKLSFDKAVTSFRFSHPESSAGHQTYDRYRSRDYCPKGHCTHGHVGTLFIALDLFAAPIRPAGAIQAGSLNDHGRSNYVKGGNGNCGKVKRLQTHVRS
jgi:hypothetical protein